MLAISSHCAPSLAATIPTYGYEVVRAYPHDVSAFTQGLFYKGGVLYESTGLLGRSSIRKVRLETGEVLLKVDFPPQLFGEGITAWDERLIAVTWYSQVGFVFDLKSFTVVERFSYPGEGWGLTRNDRQIIMSDGTAELRFLDPKTLREVRRLRVSANGKPVDQLNELEWVEGEIFSNIWRTDRIARIHPETGEVVGWIDLAGILPPSERVQGVTNVLNGIAYDPLAKRLFVTGKLWPKLFEIRLLEQPASAEPVRKR
jgi:glutaminyl-peptide cyclotransferase